MATVQSILTLKRLGWSNRRIERELHIRRETVSRHIQLAQQDSKPATNAPPGSEVSKPATNASLGSATEDAGESQDQSVKRSGQISQCEPFRKVGKVFAEVEKEHLLPLPPCRFGSFEEAKRSVHRDGHIEVAKGYYSVPLEYVGREVWARWDGHLVRIFNFKMEQITLHVQGEPGKFQTKSSHIDPRKISNIEHGTVWLLRKASLIGPQTDLWAQAMLKARGIQGVRPLVGLLNLAHRYPRDLIEDACEIALSYDAFRLRTIRKLIKRGGSKQEPLQFIDEHPIIRQMSDYGEFVKDCFG
jgi:hypothetical protein